MTPRWWPPTATTLARRCREGAIHPNRSRPSIARSRGCPQAGQGRDHDPRLCPPRHHHPVRGTQLGPWCSLEAVEFATLAWGDWFTPRPLLEPIGNIPPAEAEGAF